MEANSALKKNEEELTELDFVSEWEGKVSDGITYLNGAVRRCDTSTADGMNLVVHFEKQVLNLPIAIAKNVGLESAVAARNIRYCTMTSSREEEAQLVLLSVWISSCSPRKIVNIYLVMGDVNQALLCVNAVSRLIYEANDRNVVRTHKCTLILSGYVDVIKCTTAERDEFEKQRNIALEREEDEKAKSGGSTEREFASKVKMELSLPSKQMFFLLDEESLGFYGHEFSATPEVDFRFYKEQTELSIDAIFVCNLTGQLEIQQGDMVFIVKRGEQAAMNQDIFSSLTKKLRNRDIKPKPMNIFTDPAKYEAFCTGRTIPTSPAQNQGNASRQTPQYAAGAVASGGVEHNPADLVWLNYLCNGSHLNSSDEDMQIMWFSIEGELDQLIKDGKIPMISPESGGLDDQSAEHLSKAIEDIKDHLLSQRCSLALSRLRACRQIFGETLLKQTHGISELELMKRIYFLSG